MGQEQLYAAVIIIGVIFSILTNVALYYYGEAKDLKQKVNQGEYLYVRGEEFLFGKLRDTDRRIIKVEDELKKWMGVSDDKA